jgi:16S rRNA processing protein RimM
VDLVTVGRIVKAHGIRGEVSVHVLSDVPGRLDAGVEVVVGGRPATIVTSRPHQGRLLLRFEGVADRTGAELLRGQVIEAEPVDVADSETYFAHELVDLAVVSETGEDLGRVTALIELPPAAGYDLLEVRRADGSTWLLPAVDDYVEVGTDEAGQDRLVLVDPPAGLVEPDPDPVPEPGPPRSDER